MPIFRGGLNAEEIAFNEPFTDHFSAPDYTIGTPAFLGVTNGRLQVLSNVNEEFRGAGWNVDLEGDFIFRYSHIIETFPQANTMYNHRCVLRLSNDNYFEIIAINAWSDQIRLYISDGVSDFTSSSGNPFFASGVYRYMVVRKDGETKFYVNNTLFYTLHSNENVEAIEFSHMPRTVAANTEPFKINDVVLTKREKPEFKHLSIGNSTIQDVYLGQTKIYGGVRYLEAIGGEVLDYTQGGIMYRTHTFTTSSNFVVLEEATPAELNKVDFLVIAGGGGGAGCASGGSSGAGGGAGGYRTSVGVSGGNSPVEEKFEVTAMTYPIVVGGGGSGRSSFHQNGGSGGNSSFGTITSTGGGGGASFNSNGTSRHGLPGGSAGGSTHGTAVADAPGIPGQGSAGGAMEVTGFFVGGGGGAGADGGNGNSSIGGAGGAGLGNTIRTGAVENRAGGGGSGSYNRSSGASGGLGGGGRGAASNNVQAVAGASNTGSGGGGAARLTGGSAMSSRNGGSGIVIIRYQIGVV